MFFLKHYEIEIVNSKKYGEQLKLTRSSIKSQLFKIINSAQRMKFSIKNFFIFCAV